MEKISFKSVFVVFLAFTAMMSTVYGETSQTVLHHQASPQIVKPFIFEDKCKKGCRHECIPVNRITICLCVC
ncbi:hypothetical protein AALP_AA3G033300 [Arabis alpina]|uniref:Knottin scorpion toxin-like domain-containing protein n=1 Tax=Arabis alpina TaxID=50452 RepID=A0A087H6R7_ARAAL|nr:hypothetical protein AALP_AA3G033300 [Arabis alpina]